MDMKTRSADAYAWPSAPNAIPRDIFHREDIFRAEIERIFHGPCWHPVAHDAEIPEPHDYKTFTLGERPLLISRGADGAVRAFINACSHRGVLLVPGFRGHGEQHECPYHRWSFDSAGALRVCPGEDDFIAGFDKADFGLPPVRLESIHGLHFATLDPAAPPLGTFLAGMEDIIGRILGGDGRLTLLGYQKVIFNCNWKAYFDQDGWHAPMLHAAFRMLNWVGGKGVLSGTPHGHRNAHYEIVPNRKPPLIKDPSVIAYEHRPEDGGQLAILFPTTNMNKQMDTMTVRYAVPLDANRTEVHYTYFAHQDDDDATRRHRLRQSSNMLGPSGFITLEDGAVFNRITKARGATGNNYMVKGMRLDADPYTDSQQNDEMQCVVFWDAYRRALGMTRAD